MEKILAARFPGKCSACKGRIEPGQMIHWSPATNARHLDCNAITSAPVPAPTAVKVVTFWCRGAVNQPAHAVEGVPARTVRIEGGRHNGGKGYRGPRPEHTCARCQESETNLNAAYREQERVLQARQYAVIEDAVRRGEGRLNYSPATEARLNALSEQDIEERRAIARRFGI